MSKPIRRQAIVVHSGGMDSSLCLALAIREFGVDNVLAMSFNYKQRHVIEMARAAEICQAWGVQRVEIDLNCLSQITHNALIGSDQAITHEPEQAPNTLVVGRNGLMGRLAAIHAEDLGAHVIYMGVIGVEGANSGYRDCSRAYMDKLQEILRIDLGDSSFEIRTPVVSMSKKETMDLGHRLGVLEYLLDKTITCYEGLPRAGCRACPSCKLRNEGITEFLKENPDFAMPYDL